MIIISVEELADLSNIYFVGSQKNYTAERNSMNVPKGFDDFHSESTIRFLMKRSPLHDKPF